MTETRQFYLRRLKLLKIQYFFLLTLTKQTLLHCVSVQVQQLILQLSCVPLSARTMVSRFSNDEPPGMVAVSASSFHLAALLLISSLSMASLTCAATCSLLTSGSSRTPTPHTSQAYLQLVYWSENPGQHTIGTPAATPSHVEFHPLCVRKQPTAGWRSTCSCGHHARHVAPPRRRSPEVRGQHGRAAASAADEFVPDAP